MVNTKIQAQEPYALLSEDNTILTFYYDKQRESRGGISVGPYHYRPKWCSDQLEKVVFDTSFAKCSTLTSTAYWFDGCTKLITIEGFENLNTANVTDMRYMFSGCRSLTSLDLSNLNTEKVTDMRGMFYGVGLSTLDLSSFNTANVKYMTSMFGYSSLISVNLSNFNTGNVLNMSAMFSNCSSLTSLDLSSFNTEKVRDMRDMFSNCSSLTSLDLSNFNTANVKDMYRMFDECSNLIYIDLSNFNVSNVELLDEMFYGCAVLKTIYSVSDWNNTSGTRVFYKCFNIVGGQGTTYDFYKTESTYARIDGGVEAPGYFTYKAPTGINDVTKDSAKNTSVYNLSGQRLTAPQKGINIINGKKVIVK